MKKRLIHHTMAKASAKIKENIISGFAETDIYITNDIAAKLGARAEHSQIA